MLIFIAMMVIAASGGSAQAADAEYVGVKKCKGCHRKQYKIWQGTAHAKPFSDLEGKDQKDTKCLECHFKAPGNQPNEAKCRACHTTGFNAPAKAGADLEAVMCEACHGAGSLYRNPRIMNRKFYKRDKEGQRAKAIKVGLIPRPGAAVCKKCHNSYSPDFKGFNFARYFEKIKHFNE